MDTDDYALIRDLVDDRRDRHRSLLRTGMDHSVTDLDTFQEWVATRLRAIGVETDSFRLTPSDVTDQPAYQRTIESDPEGLRTGRNVVGVRAGDTDGPSTLLFAHADKNPITFEQATETPAFRERGDRFVGPGIADDVSGVTAILSAIEVVADSELAFAGDLLVGSVLGKQFGVLGTYGLVTRYDPTDTAIYIHPAETEAGLNELKIGSNGICEFRIEIEGKPPDTAEAMHTVFRESAINPIEKAATIQECLLEWADQASAAYSYGPLEKLADRSISVMVGNCRVDAGDSVYRVPDRCILEGTVCFPPSISRETIQTAVQDRLRSINAEDQGIDDTPIELTWGDFVADSAATPADSEFLERGVDALEEFVDRRPTHYYGHTASDIRYPLLYWDADTFGFGPLDEWIDMTEYRNTIETIVALIATTDQSE
ncbi:MAG: M20 family metallopeptidase [Halobacteriales archaeon]